VSFLSEQELKKIEESWLLLPSSLIHVDTISDHKLYSSKKLQDQIIEVFSRQSFFSSIIDKIKNLVERQIVLPCFAHKSLIQHLKDRILSKNKKTLINQYTVGYFSATKNKVFVIVDGESISHLDNLSESSISKTTLHELQHYCAFNLKNNFLNLNKKSVLDFYTDFFKRFFGISLSTSDIEKIADYIFKSYELNSTVNINFLSSYASLLDNIFKKTILSQYQRESKIIELLSTLKIFLQDGDAYINLLKQRNDKVVNIYSDIIRSYKKIGVVRPTTIAIQELVYPSEIVAIESEYNPSSNHYKVIEMI
jgi:hypothetical protein